LHIPDQPEPDWRAGQGWHRIRDILSIVTDRSEVLQRSERVLARRYLRLMVASIGTPSALMARREEVSQSPIVIPSLRGLSCSQARMDEIPALHS
jgi:hypothetical protein